MVDHLSWNSFNAALRLQNTIKNQEFSGEIDWEADFLSTFQIV
jgi:hypothetical protein